MRLATVPTALYSARQETSGGPMSNIRFDVLGIGNAIVDVIGRCEDGFLERHGTPKGACASWMPTP